MLSDSKRLAQFAKAVRESTLRRLEAIPHGQENWRPTESALSVAEIAAHIADADEWLLQKFRQPELEPMTALAGAIDKIDRIGLESLLQRLLETGKQRTELIRKLSAEQLSQSVFDRRFGGDVEVWWLITRGNLDHEIHHRGQLATYLHMIRHEEIT